MKTYYLYGAGGAIQVPNERMRHLAKGQTTVSVRGFDLDHVVQNTDGSYAGFISISDAEKCKAGLCNPRNH